MIDSLFSDVKYLTINEQDINWGLTVTDVGFQSIAQNMDYPPNGHPFGYWFNPDSGRTLQEFQIVYVTEGKGKFSSDSVNSFNINAGYIFMLFPGEWHSYRPDQKTGWDTFWVGFKGYFADQLIKNSFFSKSQPILRVGFNEELATLFRKIIDLSKLERIGYQQAISGITIHILGLLKYYELNKDIEDNEIFLKIDKARLMIREHADITPQEIANALNMSYSWFRRTFKKYTGLAPNQYQLQIKVQKSKEMLINSSKSIKEISGLLNFESTYYFSILFKKKTGMTPLEFRNICKGKAM